MFIENGESPDRLHFDNGTEYSLICKPSFKEKWELEVYKSKLTRTKNAMAEICNRLIQEKIYRLMEFRGNHVWFDRLSNIVTGINEMKRDILFGFSSKEKERKRKRKRKMKRNRKRNRKRKKEKERETERKEKGKKRKKHEKI